MLVPVFRLIWLLYTSFLAFALSICFALLLSVHRCANFDSHLIDCIFSFSIFFAELLVNGTTCTREYMQVASLNFCNIHDSYTSISAFTRVYITYGEKEGTQNQALRRAMRQYCARLQNENASLREKLRTMDLKVSLHI